MKIKFYMVIFICLVFSIESVSSQDTIKNTELGISTFKMFRDPSYILIGSGIGNLEPLIFEGDVVPYYMLSVNQNAKWGIDLSPRILVRMYDKYSYPIRTPSFMPRVTFFYQLIDNDDVKRDLFTYVSWFHHSNGQDGYFYNTDSTTFNTLSGSFSTNWIEGGVFLSRPDHNLPFITNFYKISAIYNYQQDPALCGIYGRYRFFLDYQSTMNLSKIVNIHRLTDNRDFIINQSFHLGWIAGSISDNKNIDKKRLIFRYTLSFKPSFLNDVTLFCQYYYGQDYYNIYFNRTLNVIRFGIASKVNIFN